MKAPARRAAVLCIVLAALLAPGAAVADDTPAPNCGSYTNSSGHTVHDHAETGAPTHPRATQRPNAGMAHTASASIAAAPAPVTAVSPASFVSVLTRSALPVARQPLA